MGRKSDLAASGSDSVDESLRSAAADAAVLLEDAMRATDHEVRIELCPVYAVDGEVLLRRTPLPARIHHVISDPVLRTDVVHPVARWPIVFRSAVWRLKPPFGPDRYHGAVDALIHDFTRDLENLLGTIRFAARVQTQPDRDGYYANIWDDFVLISRTHTARLALSASD